MSNHRIVIEKEISWGYAGMPVEVSISVDYEQQGQAVIITDWSENNAPFDHPSEIWWETLQEEIEGYFIDLNLNPSFSKN